MALSLTRNNQRIELAINDNGQGFDLKEKLIWNQDKKGFGLDSMRERARQVGRFSCYLVVSGCWYDDS